MFRRVQKMPECLGVLTFIYFIDDFHILSITVYNYWTSIWYYVIMYFLMHVTGCFVEFKRCLNVLGFWHLFCTEWTQTSKVDWGPCVIFQLELPATQRTHNMITNVHTSSEWCVTSCNAIHLKLEAMSYEDMSSHIWDTSHNISELCGHVLFSFYILNYVTLF
jgi:hypothetical protein